MSDDVTFLSQLIRDSMELQAQEVVDKSDNQVSKVMKPLQVPIVKEYIYMLYFHMPE